jgi:hypothetical protein
MEEIQSNDQAVPTCDDELKPKVGQIFDTLEEGVLYQ